ncbi:GHKL domain-containing protein [Enterococcus sp. BWM-S5]|uniref:GHKL domain-containing protein n=1 Tax=Enterococcus larvae TaxID=2794352 RepID=A0ABS4CL95_9ENTE|nr:GHKL domain-containing protein [Enterococcus larvae]MBP1047233.1 GHKL domain-containing protein [Enterococcus larvae]
MAVWFIKYEKQPGVEDEGVGAMVYILTYFINMIALESGMYIFFKKLFSKKDRILIFLISILIYGIFFVFAINQSTTILIFEYHHLIIAGIVLWGYYMILGKKANGFEQMLLFFLLENIVMLYLLKIVLISVSSVQIVTLSPFINLLIQLVFAMFLESKYRYLIASLFIDKKKKAAITFFLLLTAVFQLIIMTPNQNDDNQIITETVASDNELTQVDQNEVFQINRLFLVFLSVVVISVIYVAKEIKKNKRNKKMLNDRKMMESYIDTLEKLQLDIQKIQHDYKNILIGINGFLDENNDISGLKEFLQKNELIHTTAQMQTGTLNQLKRINIIEIKGLISTKMIQAIQKGIQVSIECQDEINIKRIDSLDLSRILGIIIDNAIEECENQAIGAIRIAFIDDEKKTLIIVTNTCRESSLNIDKYSEFGVSTKGDNRGIGLSNLRDIVDNYNNVSLETNCENYEFIQKLFIGK